jgi:hypothetical protein
MVGPYVERELDDRLDPPSLPSPAQPAPAQRRHRIMEDYLYYATPPATALPYMFGEFDNRPREIIRGGFDQIETGLPKTPRSLFRSFPPPSNSAYEFDSHCRLPRLQ